MNRLFSFSEALSFMKTGFTVKGPDGKLYKIRNKKIICFPKPDTLPKLSHIELRFKSSLMLIEAWSLAD